MHPNVAGALVNSGLYLLCVFVAGIVTGHPMAYRLALASMGFAFFSHVLQIVRGNQDTAATLVVVLSWIVGAAAFGALLV